MKLKIVARQGRGKRWRWMFVCYDDGKPYYRRYYGKTLAVCTGSFDSEQAAFDAAERVINSDFDLGRNEVVVPGFWQRLFGR